MAFWRILGSLEVLFNRVITDLIAATEIEILLVSEREDSEGYSLVLETCFDFYLLSNRLNEY
jgi:hypothetical protein